MSSSQHNAIGQYYTNIQLFNTPLVCCLNFTEQVFTLETSHRENKLHNPSSKRCSCIVHAQIIFRWRCVAILRETSEFDLNAE